MDSGKKILFSIDLEEFDIPEEYGQQLPLKEKLRVSYPGMKSLQQLMASHKVKATIFTTAFWAQHYPEYIRELAMQHEIASHTFYHNSFKTEDLESSRQVLSEISGQNVIGLRMPRMQYMPPDEILGAGYVYDSSLHPTWLPGRYNHFDRPRLLHYTGGLLQLPASVTPVLRIPIFWLALKNFPEWMYRALCRRILNHDGYIVFYVHPWEFTDLSKYQLPGIVKRIDGERLLKRLERILLYLGNHGDFIQHRTLIEIKNKAS